MAGQALAGKFKIWAPKDRNLVSDRGQSTQSQTHITNAPHPQFFLPFFRFAHLNPYIRRPRTKGLPRSEAIHRRCSLSLKSHDTPEFKDLKISNSRWFKLPSLRRFWPFLPWACSRRPRPSPPISFSSASIPKSSLVLLSLRYVLPLDARTSRALVNCR